MNTRDTLSTLGTMTEAHWSLKWGAVVVGAVAGYLAPVQPFLVTMAVMVAADVITGIWAAKAKKIPITSRAMGRTVNKAVFYPIAVILSHQMSETFFKDIAVVENLTYVVSLFICAIEFQSNIENIGVITGTDIWTRIRQWLSGKVGLPEAKKE